MNKILIKACLLAVGLCSCNDWLDVKPKTNIDEKDLFKNEQGFKEALTGVYIELARPALYGKEFTYGFIDILAQRYDNGQNPNARYNDAAMWYTYPSTRTEGYIETFWRNSYTLIANLNNLLSNIETNGEVIKTPGYRNIIQGEALALRSYLYFDLLRLFGPIYSTNADSPAIPYRTAFNREDKKLMPASELVDKLIADLQQAELLLENDPMQIAFPANSAENGFLSNRFNRMNRFAAKALLARVYLWKGDKVNALAKAREVIDGKRGSNKLFNLVTENSRDKLGSTELIFALHADPETFPEQVQNDFKLTSWNYCVIMNVEKFHRIFDTSVDGLNDMRIKEGVGFEVSASGAVTLKYSQVDLKSPALKNLVPMIRLSEMHYIVAECLDNLTESARELSLVRTARGIETVTFSDQAEKMNHLEKEYRKEFYGEGQLWYFYKRLGYETFLYCPLSNMKEANYRFNIPDDEIVLGNIH